MGSLVVSTLTPGRATRFAKDQGATLTRRWTGPASILPMNLGRHPLPGLARSTAVLGLLLVVVLSGGAFATGKITGKQIAKNAITSKHVKDGSLSSKDLSASAQAGLTGPQGPPGAVGAVGPAGAAGAAGPQGPKGDTGAAGATGAQGAQGATGPVGPAGAQGPKGDTGATGPTGPVGPQGLNGAPGASGVLGMSMVTTSTSFTGGQTKTVFTTTCGNDRALIGWAIDPGINQDVFTVTSTKYVTSVNSNNLPVQVGVRIRNDNGGVQAMTLDSLCAAVS